jgi:hypothetical protein
MLLVPGFSESVSSFRQKLCCRKVLQHSTVRELVYNRYAHWYAWVSGDYLGMHLLESAAREAGARELSQGSRARGSSKAAQVQCSQELESSA